MADRKIAPETPGPINTGIEASDMGIPTMSIVHHSSKACKKKRAQFGDLLIGASADDVEATVVYSNENGDAPIRVYMVGPIEKWYSSKYVPGTKSTKWDIDDPSVPADAELQYRYTLLVPSFDEDMPVRMYVKGTGIPAFRKLMTKVKIAASKGIYPYELAFDLSTEHIETNELEWFVPVLSLAEPDPSHIEMGRNLYTQIAAQPSQRQITAPATATDGDAEPAY